MAPRWGHQTKVGYHFNEFSVLTNVIRVYKHSRNLSLGAEISINLSWNSITHLKGKWSIKVKELDYRECTHIHKVKIFLLEFEHQSFYEPKSVWRQSTEEPQSVPDGNGGLGYGSLSTAGNLNIAMKAIRADFVEMHRYRSHVIRLIQYNAFIIAFRLC